MINENTFGVVETGPQKGLRAGYQRNRPAIVAATWFWLLFMVLAVITLFTGWASRPVTLLLQLFLAFFSGILAAWLHKRQNPVEPRYVRMGALAGFYLPLTTALIITLVVLVTGIGSYGLLLPLMIPYFVSLPVEMGACSMLGAAGAWLFKKIVRQ